MKYAGAEWLKGGIGQEPSVFGAKVADMLGEVYAGIYHLDQEDLRAANFTHRDFVEVAIPGHLSTYDANHLTRLVVMCHDAAIRLELTAKVVRRRDFDSCAPDDLVRGRCPECHALIDPEVAMEMGDLEDPYENNDSARPLDWRGPSEEEHKPECDQGIIEYPSLFALFSARTRDGDGAIRHYTRHPSIEQAIEMVRAGESFVKECAA